MQKAKPSKRRRDSGPKPQEKSTEVEVDEEVGVEEMRDR